MIFTEKLAPYIPLCPYVLNDDSNIKPSVQRQKGLSIYLKQQSVRPFCLRADETNFADCL